jgi:NAD(P)H-dependent FMN reductase
MNRQIRIVDIGSRKREGSFRTLEVRVVLDLSNKNYCAEKNLLDLRHATTYNLDDSSDNNIQEIGDHRNWVDALVLASPDYHGVHTSLI